MGLISWWKQRKETAKATRRSWEISENRELIAQYVPELSGMDTVEGMAYTLRQIDEWKVTRTENEALLFAQRLIASRDTWQADGLTMPYWANLWVMRTLQAELGYDVPRVAPNAANKIDLSRA